MIQTFLKNKNRLTDLENSLMLISREGGKERIVRESEINVFTLPYLK